MTRGGSGNPGGRLEGTSSRVKNVIPLDLVDISDHFNIAMGNIKREFSLAKKMAGNKNEKNAEQIWRSLIVFLVSALDYYMHGLTGYGLCQMYNYEEDKNSWWPSKQYENLDLNINIEYLKTIARNENMDWLLNSVSDSYGTRSLVSFRAIKRQLDLLDIDIKTVAYEAFKDSITRSSGDKYEACLECMEKRLDNLCKDRNTIAHQANRAYDTREIIKIDEEEVEKYINDIEKMVKAISTLAGRKE